MSTNTRRQWNDPVFTLSRQQSAMDQPPIFSGMSVRSGSCGRISGRKWGLEEGDLSRFCAGGGGLYSCRFGRGDKSCLGRGKDLERLSCFGLTA